jgi:hypothetical protein
VNPYVEALGSLARARVPYVVVGAFGANLYGEQAGIVIRTLDCDLLLPADEKILARALKRLRRLRFRLEAGGEPLPDEDRVVLKGIVRARACVRAVRGACTIDLPLEIAGCAFKDLWKKRRRFRLGGIGVNVAPLEMILKSKERAGREKDLLFLATYQDALKQLLGPKP